LGQVVLNLVVNAADALTGQSAPMPRIDVSVSQSGTWAEVIVRDNGPGVPVEKREHIFQAFFSSKLEHGGTGLGLAVSRTIATEHGGRLYLESKEGSGACFILRLPLPASLN
jgi:signal transduction histidine kinase